jgi:hypothetical protein
MINFPIPTAVGDQFEDPASGNSWLWDGIAWLSAGGAGGGGGATEVWVGDSPPTEYEVGSLWWNSSNGTMYVWYDDGDTQQWVATNPSGGGGGGEPVTPITAGTGLTGGVITTTGAVALDTAYTDARYVNLTGDTMTGALTVTGSPGTYTDITGSVIGLHNTAISAGQMIGLVDDGYAGFRNRDAPSTGVNINGKNKNNETVGLSLIGYSDANTIYVGNVEQSVGTTYSSSNVDYAHPAFGCLLYNEPSTGNYNFRLVTTTQTSYFFFQGGTGNAVANNGNWVSNSDAKNKENVVSLSKDARLGGTALDLIGQLNPCTYNRIGVNADEVGFIAQEVEAVLPNVVVPYTYSEGPTEEGAEPVMKEGMGLNYNGIIAYQAMAIQELHELVKALEARITTLEAI